MFGNKNRICSSTGKALLCARDDRVERSFAHSLDRGGMRCTHLRELANVEKRYIIHLAGFNLGTLLAALFGFGTPKGWPDARVLLFFAQTGTIRLLILAIWSPESPGNAECSMIVCISSAG